MHGHVEGGPSSMPSKVAGPLVGRCLVPLSDFDPFQADRAVRDCWFPLTGPNPTPSAAAPGPTRRVGFVRLQLVRERAPAKEETPKSKLSETSKSAGGRETSRGGGLASLHDLHADGDRLLEPRFVTHTAVNLGAF